MGFSGASLSSLSSPGPSLLPLLLPPPSPSPAPLPPAAALLAPSPSPSSAALLSSPCSSSSASSDAFLPRDDRFLVLRRFFSSFLAFLRAFFSSLRRFLRSFLDTFSSPLLAASASSPSSSASSASSSTSILPPPSSSSCASSRLSCDRCFLDGWEGSSSGGGLCGPGGAGGGGAARFLPFCGGGWTSLPLGCCAVVVVVMTRGPLWRCLADGGWEGEGEGPRGLICTRAAFCSSCSRSNSLEISSAYSWRNSSASLSVMPSAVSSSSSSSSPSSDMGVSPASSCLWISRSFMNRRFTRTNRSGSSDSRATRSFAHFCAFWLSDLVSRSACCCSARRSLVMPSHSLSLFAFSCLASLSCALRSAVSSRARCSARSAAIDSPSVIFSCSLRIFSPSLFLCWYALSMVSTWASITATSPRRTAPSSMTCSASVLLSGLISS
mmetsp:Transcript_3655/g.9068  ORF Transcript_3655/g.9068 Transcript_3655/m.9068 type:complete len:439 (-) Transcript_3655:1178-2494(-)